MAGHGPVLETQLVHPEEPPPAPLERRFTVGGVVSRTFSAWWRHAPAFTVMSIFVYGPLTGVLGFLFGSAPRARPEAPPGGDFLVKVAVAAVAVTALTTVLAVVQAGAVTYGTVRHLNGERARLGEMLGVGLRRGLPVVATGLLVWLAVVAGTLLLLVPGLVVLVATSVAIPAAVVERPGAVGALRRSFALTRGYRWPLLAAGSAVLAIVWALAAAVQVAATVLASIALPPEQAMAGTLLASQLGNALFSSIPIVAIAVAYHDLRVAKEGVDTAALARVFE